MTAVDYTVSVEGADPHPMFVATADDSDLISSLSQYVEVCGATCNPSLCQSFMLMGRIQSQDVDDIKTALVDAYVVANPGTGPDDYELVINRINDDLIDDNE